MSTGSEARQLSFASHNGGGSHLGEAVIGGEDQSEESAEPEKVLHFECIDVGVVRRLIVVQHEVDDIRRGADEQDLEGGIVQGVGERPEEI
jgi:hypothetical protein